MTTKCPTCDSTPDDEGTTRHQTSCIGVLVRFDHLYAMVVATVRYSLGRDTYVVDEACEIVRTHWASLREPQRLVIVRDISQRAEGCPQDGTWAELRRWIARAP